MDVQLNEFQAMLRDGARRLLANEFDSDQARSAETSSDGYSRALWSQLVELGWSSLLVPESAGGGGLGVLELAVLAEEMGRAAASSPLIVCSGFATTCLNCVSDQEFAAELLSAIAKSDDVVTAALIDLASRDERSRPKLLLVESGRSHFALSGHKELVPYAASAKTLLVSTVSTTGEMAIVAVDTRAEGITMRRNQTLGADPLFEVRFDDVVVPQHQVIARGSAAESALNRSLEVGAVLAIAEAVGWCEGLISIAVAHAKLREQFGQPIGSFQAVSHPLADMRVQTDACRLMALEAAWLIDQGRPVTLEIASAKVLANDAVEKITVDGHRVHGAIGYSKEHDAQLYTRRARAFAVAWGDNEREIERAAVALGL